MAMKVITAKTARLVITLNRSNSFDSIITTSAITIIMAIIAITAMNTIYWR